MGEEAMLRLEAMRLAVKIYEIDKGWEVLPLADDIYNFLKGVLPNE
jgi:hypothetical protein